MKSSVPETVQRRKKRAISRPLLKLDSTDPNDFPCREPEVKKQSWEDESVQEGRIKIAAKMLKHVFSFCDSTYCRSFIEFWQGNHKGIPNTSSLICCQLPGERTHRDLQSTNFMDRMKTLILKISFLQKYFKATYT